MTDVEISHTEFGDPAGPPVVLLHGLGDSGADWAPVLDGLAGFRVLVPDMRGHGDSGRAGQYSFELMRDDVLGFLDTAGLDRAALVGHSMGAVIAVLVALAAPARVTALVLEDATVPRPGDLRRPPLPEPDEPVPYDFVMVNAIRAQLTDPDPSWWPDTAGIEIRTLIVDGASGAERQEHLAASAARMPDARLVTIPVGHNVHRDRPAEFLAEVVPFLT